MFRNKIKRNQPVKIWCVHAKICLGNGIAFREIFKLFILMIFVWSEIAEIILLFFAKGFE
jgi:hypothetical protein